MAEDHLSRRDTLGAGSADVVLIEDFEHAAADHAGDDGQRTVGQHGGGHDEVDEGGAQQLPVTGEQGIADGVRLIEVGGHTPGQAMVMVETAAGRVLIASDAAHFVEELERDMPFVSMADVPQSYRVLEQIRQTDAVHVLTGHDAATLGALEPLGEPLPGLAGIIGRWP